MEEQNNKFLSAEGFGAGVIGLFRDLGYMKE